MNNRYYLLLLVSNSVPRLQNRLGLGAARGRHSIITCPPLAAGISLLTGFNRKSGAWTGTAGGRITAQSRKQWMRCRRGEMEEELKTESYYFEAREWYRIKSYSNQKCATNQQKPGLKSMAQYVHRHGWVHNACFFAVCFLLFVFCMSIHWW